MESRDTGDADRQPTDDTDSNSSGADAAPPGRDGSGDGVVISANFGAGTPRRGDAPSPGADRTCRQISTATQCSRIW